MKKLNVSAISDSARFPLKKGTLQFLQDASKEVITDLVKSLIGPAYNPAVIYVMSGCVNSGTTPNYIVSAGVIFYNGEVYDFDGATFTATLPNVAVWSIVQTQYTTDADPVTFTDLTPRNVHNIFKMQLLQAVSGSGLADILQSYYLSFQIPALLNLSSPVIAPYTDNISQVIGAYPNLFVYTPAPIISNIPIVAKGILNVGDVSPTGSSYAVTFPTALAAGSYMVLGTILSNGTLANDSVITWAYNNLTTTGFNVLFQEHRSVAQNITFNYLIVKI